MPQLSLYLDDATMATLRQAAKGADVSMSKYASSLIQDRAQHGSWPQGYWDRVYGCLPDEGHPISDDDLHPELDDACNWF